MGHGPLRDRVVASRSLHGIYKARGLNIHDPYVTQLAEHLQVILRHAHRDTLTHDLLMHNMELVQTHVGSSEPFGTISSHHVRYQS